MRFLADESCDFALVRALRGAGFDVVAVAELSPRALDEQVIDLAVQESRILLTEDKDFGQLIYASARRSGGVILVRFPGAVRKQMPDAVLDFVHKRQDQLAGCFAVVQPGRIRVRRTPPV